MVGKGEVKECENGSICRPIRQSYGGRTPCTSSDRACQRRRRFEGIGVDIVSFFLRLWGPGRVPRGRKGVSHEK